MMRLQTMVWEGPSGPDRRPTVAAGRPLPHPRAWTISLFLASCLPAAAGWPGTGVTAPLSELAPDAVNYLKTRSGEVGVAVFDNRSGRTYTWNADWRVRTASIIKVGILAAVIDRAVREGRPLTAWEKGRIWPMITVSDNTAAGELWWDVGPWNVINYLRSIGMTSLAPAPESLAWWGYSWASANDFLRLTAKIQYYQLWPAEYHDYALNAMRNLIDWEAFLALNMPDHLDIAEKSGWYPEDETGYARTHAIGAISGDDASYTIVVLTRYPIGLWLNYGTDTIGGIANRVHNALKNQGIARVDAAVRMGIPNGLNVRSGPGLNYSILGGIAGGQTYIASASKNGWWRIDYDGRVGWVLGTYATKVSGVAASVINIPSQNVRAGPGFDQAVAGQSSYLQQYVRTGTSGTWNQIWWGGASRWVYGPLTYARRF